MVAADCHLIAHGGKEFRSAASDAGGSAGDQNGFILHRGNLLFNAQGMEQLMQVLVAADDNQLIARKDLGIASGNDEAVPTGDGYDEHIHWEG